MAEQDQQTDNINLGHTWNAWQQEECIVLGILHWKWKLANNASAVHSGCFCRTSDIFFYLCIFISFFCAWHRRDWRYLAQIRHWPQKKGFLLSLFCLYSWQLLHNHAAKPTFSIMKIAVDRWTFSQHFPYLIIFFGLPLRRNVWTKLSFFHLGGACKTLNLPAGKFWRVCWYSSSCRLRRWSTTLFDPLSPHPSFLLWFPPGFS